MQKFKNRVISGLMALMMMLGIILSSVGTNAQVVEEKTDVVVHKLKLNSLQGWPKSPGENGKIAGLDGTEYDGSKIGNLTGYFGPGAEELDNVKFSYWKVTKEQYEAMMQAPADYDDVAKVKAYVNADAVAEVVTAGGQGVTVRDLVDGYYWFVEHKDSLLADGKTLSEAAAVPFGLQLPVYKTDGTRFTTGDNALHVYPKNTVADEPKTDKDFAENALNYNSPNRPKGTKNVLVGEVVNYKVGTKVPAKANYKTAKWDDNMTEGLTYNRDLVVSIGGNQVDNTHYDLVETDKGFTLSLNAKGLELVNLKNDEVEVLLTYSATVNENAIVDMPEANDVTFHYGNNPSNGNTPEPTKPNNGEIEVKKSFAEGTFPANMSVTITLYNAQTGARVDSVTLDANKTTHKFTGLDNNVEYKAVETYVPGYEAEYGVESNGVITIKNHKNPNPPPQNPSSPRVVTGGHRFQKVDVQTKEGLAGAEFVVKNADGKFLARKDNSQAAIEAGAYEAAEKAYLDAVKANKPEQEVNELKATRDAAYVAANISWKWVDTKDEANKFVSGANGYFKVTGLPYGNYALVETKAPVGYAAITTDIPFEVKANSTAAATALNSTITDSNLTVIDNKKITIPQTGGMGTVIFTAVGITLMGAAAFAMKRRNEEQ